MPAAFLMSFGSWAQTRLICVGWARASGVAKVPVGSPPTGRQGATTKTNAAIHPRAGGDDDFLLIHAGVCLVLIELISTTNDAGSAFRECLAVVSPSSGLGFGYLIALLFFAHVRHSRPPPSQPHTHHQPRPTTNTQPTNQSHAIQSHSHSAPPRTTAVRVFN